MTGICAAEYSPVSQGGEVTYEDEGRRQNSKGHAAPATNEPFLPDVSGDSVPTKHKQLFKDEGE